MGIYSAARDDLTLQSKHADVALQSGPNVSEEGWSLWFFNTPKKGKCLCIDYTPGNWPAVVVYITANWKAKRHIAHYERTGYARGSF